MLKLIVLEWKKNNLKKHLCIGVVMICLLALFMFALCYWGIANDPDTGAIDAAPGYNTISSPVELLTGMTFLVFTGVMFSSYVVTPYKNRTMELMFCYPIKRQKILASQMLAVWGFNFAALAAAKLLIYGCILLGSRSMVSAFPLDFNMAAPGFYLQLTLKSAVTVTMGFIALFVGLTVKSSKATIVTSFLLILLTQANVGDLTLSNNAALPILLTGISLLLGFLSLCRAETADLP